MTRYADKTNVSADKSLMEIRATLTRYKATGFAFGEADGKIAVSFEMKKRRVRFTVPLPAADAEDIVYKKVNQSRVRHQRTPQQQNDQYQQAVNQRGRALLLVIKAKLESVHGADRVTGWPHDGRVGYAANRGVVQRREYAAAADGIKAKTPIRASHRHRGRSLTRAALFSNRSI